MSTCLCAATSVARNLYDTSMHVAIIGASGFIGSEVTRQLLARTDYDLTLFSHRASELQFTPVQERRIRHVNGSVLTAKDITAALADCHLAVYLVHLMGSGKKGSFSSAEERAAQNFSKAVRTHGIKRVIYVGGMGDDAPNLTQHLTSRSKTGKILRSNIDQVIEFKTPMVIGQGGAGYEVLTQLVRRLPIFPVPAWARGRTYPITCADVARYVIEALTIKDTSHISVAIGGPEQLSYPQIAERYAAWKHQRLRQLPLPFVPQKLAILFLRSFKRNSYAVTVADMLGSAGYTPQADMKQARRLFAVKPEKIENGFK